MGDCNSACQKIIINSGLVAEAAEMLASMTDGELSDAATDLFMAAHAVTKMYRHLESHGAIRHDLRTDWNGCDDASRLMQWIAQDGQNPSNDPAVRVAILHTMRNDCLRFAATLCAGRELG